MDNFKLINMYLDGMLSEEEEEGLFRALSVDEDLRADFRQLSTLRSTLVERADDIRPSAGLRASVFAATGYRDKSLPLLPVPFMLRLRNIITGFGINARRTATRPVLVIVGLIATLLMINTMGTGPVGDVPAFTVNMNGGQNGIDLQNGAINIAELISSGNSHNANTQDISDVNRNLLMDDNGNEAVDVSEKAMDSSEKSVVSHAETIIADIVSAEVADIQTEEDNVFLPLTEIVGVTGINRLDLQHGNSLDDLITQTITEVAGRRFSIEYSDALYWLPQKNDAGKNFKPFGNISITATYYPTEFLGIGCNYKNENFNLADYSPEVNSGSVAYKLKEMNTLTLFLKYYPEIFRYGDFSPYVKWSFGLSGKGAVNRFACGAEWACTTHLSLYVSPEYSFMSYDNDGRSQISGKYGLNYGIGYSF